MSRPALVRTDPFHVAWSPAQEPDHGAASP